MLVENYYMMYSNADTTYNLFHVKNIGKTSSITYIPKEIFVNADTIKIAGKTYVKIKEDKQ